MMTCSALLLCLAVIPALVTANEVTTESQPIRNHVTTEDTTVNDTIEDVDDTGSYSTSAPNCGYQMTGPSGSFHSPYYPRDYPNNIDCQWSIIVNPSEQIQLTFDYFYTESCCDIVNVFETYNDSVTKLAGLLNVPFSLNSTGNILLINFTTDYSGTDVGFNAHFLAYSTPSDLTTPSYDFTSMSIGGRMTLASGTNFRLSGQQLQVYHDGRWGTVCDDGFNSETSRSICYILNGYYPTCARFFNGGYGPTTPNKIWLDQLECRYSYHYPYTDCSANPWGVNDCSHSEDVHLDCNCYTTYEITTATHDSVSIGGRINIAQGTNFRLSGQQLQVYHDGRWGTVCDDGFNSETSRSICYILNGYYPTCARFFNGGYGHTTPNNIWLDQLECRYSYYYAHTECSASPWGVNDCSHSEDVYLDCNCDFTYEQTTSDIGPTSTAGRITIEETTVDTATTMAYPVATSASLDLYVRSITVDCNPDAWNIMIYLPDLYKRHTDFDPSDIYFGRPGCQGYRVGNYLRIDQQYSNCDTHHFMTFGRVEYTNTLVYAYRDPNYKFIIREYRFKIDVECDMETQETVSQHFIESHNQVRVRSNNPSISSSGHYHVHMTFYRCTSDVNTHVLYLSSHETRFVFRDFEYDTNQDNLYLFCTATFCNVTDYSSACDQSCHSVKRRSVQSPSQNFIRRAETSEALHLSTGRSRRETGEIDETKTAGHAQYIIVDDHLFIAVIVSAVGISAIAIFVVIRRYKKPRSRPIDTI